jgi:sec-independent protein translocase protein TatA
VIGDILQPTHLLLILVVALIVLGPKRLPEVGRSLGRGLRDFRSAISGQDHDPSPETVGELESGETEGPSQPQAATQVPTQEQAATQVPTQQQAATAAPPQEPTAVPAAHGAPQEPASVSGEHDSAGSA